MSGKSDGIYVYDGDLNISGGNVTTVGEHGIYVYKGDLNISGGHVTAEGDCGIYVSEGNLNVSDGRVTAEGIEDGICVDEGSFTVSGGQVAVEGGEDGIYLDESSLIFSGGHLIAEGNTLGEGGAAFNRAPDITATTYKWRTSAEGTFTSSSTSAYAWKNYHWYAELDATDTTAPTLTAGEVSRTGESTATFTFTSDEEGKYYYAVSDTALDAVTLIEAGNADFCVVGSRTVDLANLTTEATTVYICATDAAGNTSNVLVIHIPAYVPPVYAISADPMQLDFGNEQEGYTTIATQTVTVTNTGNQPITLEQPTATNYTIGTLSETELAPGETATFTVQPNSDLAAGIYDTLLIVWDADNAASITIAVRFTVREGGVSTVPLRFIAQPTDAEVYESEPATFTVTVTGGTEPYGYQWQVDRGSGFENVDGATDASYTIVATTLENDGERYCCIVTDASGAVLTSDAAVLSVFEKDEPPKTGEDGTLFLLLGLLLLSFGGTATLLLRKRRKG